MAGGEITVGAVAVDIVPSAKNFLSRLLKDIAPDAAKVGEAAGKVIGERIAKNVTEGVEDGLADGGKAAKGQGAKAGAEFGASFVATVKSTLKAAEKALGEFTVHANMELDGAAEVVAEAKAVQQAVSRLGDVEVGVDMDAAEFFAEATAVDGMVRGLSKRAVKIGLDTSSLDKAADDVRDVEKNFDGAGTSARKAKTEVEGFAKTIQTLTAKAAKSISIRVGLDSDAVYPELAKIKAALAAITAGVGVDFDDNEAFTRIRELGVQLDELSKKRSVNFGVGEDFDNVSKLVRGFIADIEDSNVKLEGFAATLKKVAQQASSRITIRTDLDGDEVYTELAQIKARLNDIVVKIGVEMNPAEAYAEMAVLRARLAELTRKRSIDVGVNRDVASVASIFSGIDDALKKSTESAGGLLQQLSKMSPVAAATNIAFVGVFAALPAIIAVVAAGLAGLLGLLTALAGLAVTAGLGFGVLLLALTPIIKAIQEQGSATKRAAQATLEAAQAEQTALANKIALAGADKAVASAETALARARVNGARQVAQANKSLIGAQRNLVQANDRERDARKKLSLAYKDAKNDLKKLNEEIRKNRIEQEAANAALFKSREDLNALYADPTASASDIQSALAEYHAREQALRDLKVEQQKNATEKAKYDKDGLAANAGVISAQAAVKSAVESVRDAQDAVATAAQNAAQAQIDAAQSVNDAEQALADARTSRANTIKQQQLAATVTTAQKTVTDADKNDATSQLTKKGLEFVKFYEEKLKPIVDKLFQTAQDSGILSGIEGFFDAIRPALGPIGKLIGTVGHSLGVFFIQIGNFLGSKEGTDFINFLAKEAPKGFKVLAEIAKGGLGFFFKLIEKFGPVMEKLAPVLVDALSKAGDVLLDFLNSSSFEDLIKVMVDNLPVIVEFVVQLLVAFLKLIPVLAPFGQVILEVLTVMLEGFNALPVEFILGVIAAVLVAAGTLLAVFAGPVLAVIGGVILAITGVSLVISYLYTHWDEIWQGIKKVTKAAWDFLYGVFSDAFTWVRVHLAAFIGGIETRWDNFWNGVQNVASSAWDHVTSFFSTAFDNVHRAFQAGVDGIGRIWEGIRAVLSVPVAGAIRIINEGIIDPFNTVAGYFGSDGVDKIKTPEWVTQGLGMVRSAASNVLSRATGGLVPGYQSSKRDEVPAMLRKGEAVLVPEVVREIGPAAILEWNRKANLGQRIRPFAYGGLVDDIVAFERKAGIPFNVTSGVRNSNDYHGRGMAVDTADSADNMLRLASWLYGYSPFLLELIHSAGPGYFVKNGAKKGRDFYGAATVADHYDHVHTAMNKAGLAKVATGAKPSEFSGQTSSDEPSGLAGWALGKIEDVLSPLVDGLKSKFGDNKLVQMLADGPGVLLAKAGKWLVEKAKALGGEVLSGLSTVGNAVLDLFRDDDSKEGGTLTHKQGVMAVPQTAAKYAKQVSPKLGFGSTDMEYLAKLWNGESGWRWNATGSLTNLGRAYGIPQSLPGNKMASAGSDWATNAFTQVDWGLAYIKDRYKNPTNAYLTWLGRNPHWYDTGGYLPPGLTLAYNGTGRHERVMTHEEEQAMLRERSALLQGRADVNIHVHDGKVSGLVTAEVDRQFGILADNYVYGGV